MKKNIKQTLLLVALVILVAQSGMAKTTAPEHTQRAENGKTVAKGAETACKDAIAAGAKR